MAGRLGRASLSRNGAIWRASQTGPIAAAMVLKKLLALLALLFWTGAALADVLVDNVNGYTLDTNGHLVRFTAMWVGDDGKVIQLFQKGDRKPDRTRYRFDGQGKTLLPGLIDAHGHVMDLGLGALELDLTGTRSVAEAQAKIAAYAAAHPSQRWILGWGWNQENWGGALPDRRRHRRGGRRPAGLAGAGRRPCRLG